MREYFLGLIGVCLVTAFSSMLAPEGSLSRWLKLASALCAVSVIISPMFSFIDGLILDDFDILSKIGGEYEDAAVYEDIYSENITKESIYIAEKNLCQMLCSSFSLDAENISLSLETEKDEQSLKVCRAHVYLSGRAIFVDPYAITDYLKGILDCECEIIYT